MAEVKAKRTGNCGCQIKPCKDSCDKPDCKVCKVCCEDNCPGCEKHCTQPSKCKCRVNRCGCETNCYGEDGEDKECKNANKCKRCIARCGRLGSRCICANCDCGCSYGLCNCCPWCKRNTCSGVCNGYVIGRCKEKDEKECKGHYRYEGANDSGTPTPKPEKVSPAIAQDYEGKLCLYKCTACGRLCAKHICHCIGSIFIAIGAIVFTIFVAWRKYPEKFRRVYYNLRSALNIAPGRPGRPLGNLVSDSVPVETTIDRYPAFRPRAYVGLS